MEYNQSDIALGVDGKAFLSWMCPACQELSIEQADGLFDASEGFEQHLYCKCNQAKVIVYIVISGEPIGENGKWKL